jgi:hypothetical protein
MELTAFLRKTTVVETAIQSARLRLPDCKHVRKVTLRISRTTEVNGRYADVTYAATLSIACAVESAEIDSQDVTDCVSCEHLFGLFSGTNPDACPDLRLNAMRNSIRTAAKHSMDPCEPFPLQHSERIRALLPALSV